MKEKEIVFGDGISVGEASHYFSADDSKKDELRYFDYKVGGRILHITSNSGVFSKNHVDRGSELLINTVRRDFADGLAVSHCCDNKCSARGDIRIADLGTGYGIILLSLLAAIAGSSGVGYEVSNRALRLARINAKKNGFREVVEFVGGDLSERLDDSNSELFDIVVTNPPIRAGKNTVYDFFGFAEKNLAVGGAFYAVISKNQGAGSAKKYLEELFGNAKIAAKDGEFRIIKCYKNCDVDARKLPQMEEF